VNEFVTDKLEAPAVYSHTGYTFWISMIPGVLWYVTRSL